MGSPEDRRASTAFCSGNIWPMRSYRGERQLLAVLIGSWQRRSACPLEPIGARPDLDNFAPVMTYTCPPGRLSITNWGDRGAVWPRNEA